MQIKGKSKHLKTNKLCKKKRNEHKNKKIILKNKQLYEK